jgi:probable HAF family extracellular repeat protein
MIDLGTLGGVRSYARGINKDGRVVGGAATSQGAAHAFITGPDGIGMTDLGVLPGGCCFSDAYGINTSGQVVGSATSSSGSYHAFVTGANGVGMTDLNDLATLESDYFQIAYGINDQGQIIAGDSSGRAYLLSPVPEPKAFALILVGLGLVGFAARKQGKQARLGVGF